jgi:hypothetical protein
MTYGETLRERKNKRSQPNGRESWKGAINQAKGNIEWMLDNFNSDEILEFIVDIKFGQFHDHNELQYQYHQIIQLNEFLSEMQKRCRTEINRIEELESFKEDNSTEEINIEEILEAIK